MGLVASLRVHVSEGDWSNTTINGVYGLLTKNNTSNNIHVECLNHAKIIVIKAITNKGNLAIVL